MDELEQEFICGVCLEQFEKPVVFPCSHNFCSKCVQDLINHVDQRGTSRFINCPSCRKNVDVTRGVSKLTRNIVLERIIELHMTKLANGNTKLSKPCIKHSDCDLEFYCKTCHKAVCQRCTQESHNGFGHNVKYFSELVLEEKHSISNQLEELDRLVTQLKTKQEILFARENEFKSKTNEIVKQTTKPLRDSVNKCRDYQVQGSGLHEMCSRAIRGQGIPPEQTLQRLNDLKTKLIQFLAFEAKICADSIVPSVDSLKLNMIDLLQPQQSVLTKSDGKIVNSKIQFWNPKALNGTTLEYPDNITLTAMSLESEPAQKKKLPPTQDAATQDRDFSFKAPSFTVGRKW